MNVFSHFQITGPVEAIRPWRIDFETNDDEDTGYPGEVVHDTYYATSLEKALNVSGRSRTGFAGHRVEVMVNGRKV